VSEQSTDVAVPASLVGKVVMVTGGGAGVGRGVALACAAIGASVVVTGRRVETLGPVVAEIEAKGGGALAVRSDVTVASDVRDAVAAALDRFGRLDAVVHNATSARSSEVIDLEHAPLADWRDHAAVSITASYRLAVAAHPHLRAAAGSMLWMTSPAGIDGSANLSFYAMAKATQRGMVKALAHEWGPDGIRVNGLAPLAMTPAMEHAFVEDPALEQRLVRRIPLRRMGDSETDIGPPAAFLCSDAARYITGQTLVVSGGRFTAL
jgi:NAD(P)-dependent dehydrogenase (short-subunit alcohol dehydrogenase family)